MLELNNYTKIYPNGKVGAEDINLKIEPGDIFAFIGSDDKNSGLERVKMQWIRDVALFLVFSGIMLELISDTKYYKFAKWVAGMILLLQFIKPLADTENFGNWFVSRMFSFDYALGTDRVLEEIYAEYKSLLKRKNKK